LEDNGPVFSGKKIVLGITASIAAYKAAYICSRLTARGAEVIPVMTLRAQNFINPITFSSISGNETVTGQFVNQGRIYHVSLSQSASAYCIAPASADVICKLANGICDDFLTTSTMAAVCPVLLAPAMNEAMYRDPAVTASIEKLKVMGKYQLAGPAEGSLACGDTGLGRMEDEDVIIGRLSQLLMISEELKGKKVLISAGGTREYLDIVRFISNASSGKMGYSLAEEAVFRGAEDVVLVSTVPERPVPYGVRIIYVDNTSQMKEAMLRELPGSHVIIMAAAVSDVVPESRAAGKISKKDGLPGRLRFKLNENILHVLSTNKTGKQLLMGFAAESGYDADSVLEKFSGIDVDMIAVNDIAGKDRGIGSDFNEVEILSRYSSPVKIPLNTKRMVARGIWDEVIGKIKRD
jgi:phosphopantothenoylcysteine decarboxylase / phosphopantothenate---cysteine ligase